MKKESIVRENLMERKGYSPYRGSNHCTYRMPRTAWNKSKEQFTCTCGRVSEFPSGFIQRYKLKWNK